MIPKHRQKSSRKAYQIGHNVLDGKLLLVDVGGVGTTGDGGHGGQVAAVAAHDFLKNGKKFDMELSNTCIGYWVIFS